VTNVLENLRKKNQTETQNTVECQSSRLEQVEDRISGLKDNTEIKEKSEEILVKQLCKKAVRSQTPSKEQT
jgi:hypothetical protein